jgi:hypothetical protein
VVDSQINLGNYPASGVSEVRFWHFCDDVRAMSHFSRPTPNIAPSWNVAPTDRFRWAAMIPRSLDVTRRGLVRFWAKDIKVGFANINAKAEGIGLL